MKNYRIIVSHFRLAEIADKRNMWANDPITNPYV